MSEFLVKGIFFLFAFPILLIIGVGLVVRVLELTTTTLYRMVSGK